jgi:hypothetical protein
MRADLPILFKPEMVKAILREIAEPGTGKTQTRRILSPDNLRIWTNNTGNRGSAKPSPELFEVATEEAADFRMIDKVLTWTAKARDYQAPAERTRWQGRLKHTPGMKLWVREMWRVGSKNDLTPPRNLRPRTMTVIYAAGGSCVIADGPGGATVWAHDDWPGAGFPVTWAGKLRQAMHLPRWGSRITLDVTGSRVERLQDISEADAIAEGITPQPHHPGRFTVGDGISYASALRAYAALIDAINGPGTWEANPYVTVTTFKPELRNIDDVKI